MRRLLREGPFLPLSTLLKRPEGGFCVILQTPNICSNTQITPQMSAGCRNLVSHHLDLSHKQKKKKISKAEIHVCITKI